MCIVYTECPLKMLYPPLEKILDTLLKYLVQVETYWSTTIRVTTHLNFKHLYR